MTSRDAVRQSRRAEMEAARASAAQIKANREREARQAPITGRQLKLLRELRAERGLPDRDEALRSLSMAKASALLAEMTRKRDHG